MGWHILNTHETFNNCPKIHIEGNTQKHKQYPSTLIYKETGLLPLRNLYAKSILKFIHLNKKIQTNNLINTRSQSESTITVPKVNKTLTQRQVTFLGPKLYNKLPIEIRRIQCIKTFLRKIKLWLTSISFEAMESFLS